MTNQTASKDDPRELALDRCDDLIKWYERNKSRQRVLDNVLQTSVIVAAGLTAFAAAIESWPKWAIVLPAVITTVATGLSMNFRFRTKYVNFASAGERLKWVKLRYQIRSEGAPTDTRNLEEFVNGMEAVVSAELAEWREGLLSGDIAGKSRGGAGEGRESVFRPTG
jgi:conflict system pore-forming effector with SLATT domain